MEQTTTDAPVFTLHSRATAEESYHQTLLASGSKTPWLDVARRILLPLFVSGIAVTVIELPFTRTTDLTVGLIGLFVAIWSAAGFFMLYSPWRPAEAKRRWSGDEITVSLGAYGIAGSSDYRSISLGWNAFTEIREDPHAVVFMRGGLVQMWLPGSAFESPSQRQQVLEYARAQMAAHGVDTSTDQAVHGWPAS